MKAIKPVWNGRRFRVEVAAHADPLLAHNGFLVYDDPEDTILAIRREVLIPKWSVGKKQAVIAHLLDEVTALRKAGQPTTLVVEAVTD